MTKNTEVKFTAQRAANATSTIALAMAKEAGRLAAIHDKDGTENVVPKQALSVHAAYVSGVLGGSRKPGEKAEMTQEEYAAIVGLSQSRISNFRTLGHALVVVGLEPKGDDWSRLVKVAGNVGKSVLKVTDDSPKSKAAVKKAVNALFTEDGKRKPAAKRGSDGKGADVDALFEKAFGASNAADALERVTAFVVGRLGDRVTKEAMARIEESATAILAAVEEAREAKAA